MKTKIYSLIYSLTILFFNSCGDKSVEPVEYEPLIPLSIGNYWLYQGYYLNDDGSVNFSQDDKFGFIIDDTLSQTIYGERVICYKLFNCGEELTPYYDKPGSFEGSKLVSQNEQGLFYSGTEKYDTVKMTFNDLIFPYPVTEGESVSGHVFYYSTTGNYLNLRDEKITQYKCISTDSLFNTPLGSFDCIVYKITFYDLEPLFREEVYYFIKPGLGIVGMIQMVYHYNSDKYSYFIKYLLTDYYIKEE